MGGRLSWTIGSSGCRPCSRSVAPSFSPTISGFRTASWTAQTTPGHPLARLRALGGRRTVALARAGTRLSRGSAPGPAASRFGEVPVFARVATDSQARSWLGAGWEPAEPIEDLEGGARGSVWRDGSGGVFLPFDPGRGDPQLLERVVRTGAARSAAGRAKRSSMRAYYGVRPLLPRSTQIALRTAVQPYSGAFPLPAVADRDGAARPLRRALRAPRGPCRRAGPVARTVAGGRTPGRSCSHTTSRRRSATTTSISCATSSSSTGIARPGTSFRAAIRSRTRSSRSSGERGFEVGVHGLYHDGRDLESRATLEERLPAMRACGRALGCRRVPLAGHAPLLGADAAARLRLRLVVSGHGPVRAAGAAAAAAWLPFFNEDLVELPITLPQDHTAVRDPAPRDESIWLEKASFIKSRGGMALLITHPDYFLDAERMAILRALPRAARRRRDGVARAAARGERVVEAARGVEPRAPRRRMGHRRTGGADGRVVVPLRRPGGGAQAAYL